MAIQITNQYDAHYNSTVTCNVMGIYLHECDAEFAKLLMRYAEDMRTDREMWDNFQSGFSVKIYGENIYGENIQTQLFATKLHEGWELVHLAGVTSNPAEWPNFWGKHWLKFIDGREYGIVRGDTIGLEWMGAWANGNHSKLSIASYVWCLIVGPKNYDLAEDMEQAIKDLEL